MSIKHLASTEKPKEEGWYLWWDDESPFHVLALVKARDHPLNDLWVNFDLDSDIQGFTPLDDSVAERLWLKVD